MLPRTQWDVKNDDFEQKKIKPEREVLILVDEPIFGLGGAHKFDG